MVPINAARVAAGADSLNELVVDPRTGEICRRCDTLDAREKCSQSPSQRSIYNTCRRLHYLNQSRVGLKDYIAGLTPEEKTERGRKTSKGASRRSRPLVDVFTCDVA